MDSLSLIYLILLFSGAHLALSKDSLYRQLMPQKLKRERVFHLVQALLALVITFIMVLMLTQNLNISTAIAIIASALPVIYVKSKKRKESEIQRKSWPLVVDQLATATSSGVAIHAAMIEIVERGPKSLRDEFIAFRDSFVNEGSVERALIKFVESSRKRRSQEHSIRAAQLKSTLLIARDYGGQEVGTILRNLSAHLRRQEAALDEIAIRQGWIKNSAILASVTPWVLLLIISLNSKSLSAFNSDSGRLVLLCGLIITALAYRWIRNISDSVMPQGKIY